MKDSAVYIGLGSNMGDRLANLQRAVELLAEREVEVARSSRVYETVPEGGPEQPDFLNAVVEVKTKLEPMPLLRACQQVEWAMGRVRRERWGPRVIDLDLLTYGEREVREPELEVPHPRMLDRAFVLVPLLEIDADPPLPGGRRAIGVRMSSGVLDGVRPFAPPLETAAER